MTDATAKTNDKHGWEELLWRAHSLGANGVVGVRYDVYMPYAGLFGASVTATAVKITTR